MILSRKPAPRWLTVDPGIGTTGIALWNDEDKAPRWTHLCALTGKEKKLDWVERVGITADRFEEKLEYRLGLSKVYIEYPILMTSASGMASAQRGDVFKLMFLVGALADRCWRRKIEMVPIPVPEWKGQLPKDVVAQRVKRILGVDYPNHIGDAVGMGLHLKGLLTQA